ncbi:mitochondrial 54S ribosomal protein YmL11 [Maudiozyma humilis]|uniref:Mitochondrial 54S ribosomal protein YmL11 n=1 Tax=Maudiozyma humilis TaxID=51915 RepID=A0AAV5S489_MAUHU|nr:mitochondrial 54S ribosomal protein YmL11 [Kazachstania humilis]
MLGIQHAMLSRSALRPASLPASLCLTATIGVTALGLRHGSRAVVTAKKAEFELHGRHTTKPVDSRKTFLIDYYKHMMESHPVVVFLHYNNLLKTEDHHFRDLIKATNGKLHKIRNNLFQVYLRNSALPDPCAPVDSKDPRLVRNHPLHPLFAGPTAAITYKDMNPADLAKLIKVLAPAKDKLFVIGAKVDADVLDTAKLAEFSRMPPLPAMQAQLVQLLMSASGGGLVQTLEAASQRLYLTLKAHEDARKSGEEK